MDTVATLTKDKLDDSDTGSSSTSAKRRSTHSFKADRVITDKLNGHHRTHLPEHNPPPSFTSLSKATPKILLFTSDMVYFAKIHKRHVRPLGWALTGLGWGYIRHIVDCLINKMHHEYEFDMRYGSPTIGHKLSDDDLIMANGHCFVYIVTRRAGESAEFPLHLIDHSLVDAVSGVGRVVKKGTRKLRKREVSGEEVGRMEVLKHQLQADFQPINSFSGNLSDDESEVVFWTPPRKNMRGHHDPDNAVLVRKDLAQHLRDGHFGFYVHGETYTWITFHWGDATIDANHGQDFVRHHETDKSLQAVMRHFRNAAIGAYCVV